MLIKKEKKIKNSTDFISISGTKKILNQMINCICKIKIKGGFATGFFCKVQLEKNRYINFLMTNYHVLDEKYFKENKDINLLLNDDKEALVINLRIKRETYFNEDYDVTLIELKEKDKIKNFLDLDENIFKENEKIFYEEKSIYVLQYPNGKNACVSYGLLSSIYECNIRHTSSTEDGSSGSPILNLENNKVIGIHKERSINFNLGTLLKYPLKDYIETKRNKKNIKEEKVKDNNKKNYKDNNLIKYNEFIWIDKNFYNSENEQYIELIESVLKIHLKLFQDIDSAFDYIKTIYFKEMKIIIGGGLYDKFIDKFKEEITGLYVAPKIIVFTSNTDKFFENNKDYKNQENLFYAYGGIETEIGRIIETLRNEKEIDEKIEPLKSSEKKILINLKTQEEGQYTFYYLDNKEKYTFPIYYGSLLDNIIIDHLENYTRFLFNTYSNKENKIEELLGPIKYMKNIPLELLSKYYARLYSFDSDFYKDINNELRLGKIDKKHLLYIKILYEGVKLKSLPLVDKGYVLLYRASKISHYEINYIKNYLNNKKDLNYLIAMAKPFLAFSKKMDIANLFLKEKTNKNLNQALFILELDNNIKYNYNTHCDLEKISYYREEGLVLFFPFSFFQIKYLREKIVMNKEIYEIGLLYLGSYLELKEKDN